MQLGAWCALKSYWSARTQENASSTKNQEPCQEGDRQRKALYKWREIQSNLICQLFWREVLAFVCNSTQLLPALTSFKNGATERYFLLASQKWEELAVLALSVQAVCSLWAMHVCFCCEMLEGEVHPLTDWKVQWTTLSHSSLQKAVNLWNCKV